MAKKMVTMRDVAEAAGVSRTAVSFVVNKRDKGVSTKVKHNILRAMQDLNYRPSLLAQGLRGEKTMLVAVILPQLSGDGEVSLLRDVETLANKTGYQVMLAQHQDDMEMFVKGTESLLGRHVDGMIISGPLNLTKAPIYQELRESEIPIVFVNRDPGDDQVNFVAIDVGRAMQTAVRHLFELGHRRIALYHGQPEPIEAKTRHASYRTTMEDLGLGYDPDLVYTSELPAKEERVAKQHVQDKLAAQMSLKDPPTAIIGASRSRAIAVFESIEAMQLRIPEDISLVAITGLRFRDFHRAKITSVRYSYENLGRLAFTMLVESISGDEPLFRRAYIPAALVAGETTRRI